METQSKSTKTKWQQQRKIAKQNSENNEKYEKDGTTKGTY